VSRETLVPKLRLGTSVWNLRPETTIEMEPTNSRQRLKLAIGATVPLIVAVAGTFLVEQFAPFDRRFETCEESEAQWKLVVRCSVDGSSDGAEHVDYFRPRPVRRDETWGSVIENDSQTQIECESILGSTRYSTSMSIACHFGPDAGAGIGESYRFTATDTSAGVEMAIGYERSEGDRALPIQQAKFIVPLGRRVRGRQGTLEYAGTWEKVK